MKSANLIYKIIQRPEWEHACTAGVFAGAEVDLADGYIHFSDASQVKETAAKHFAGQHNLLLVVIDADSLGPQLIWEPSRGGSLFPHLYGPLDPQAALAVHELHLANDGRHCFDDVL